MAIRASTTNNPKRAPSDPTLLTKAVMEKITGEKWERPNAEPERVEKSTGGRSGETASVEN